MTKVIVIGTLKGGVAKTLSTFQIAGILAEEGHKVLCIDVDPQANLSTHFGINIANFNLKGVREIFDYKKVHNFKDLVIKSPIKELPTLDIIPATMLLHEAEVELPYASGRESILSNYMYDNKDYFFEYDYILIDTNPSVGYLNQNAFMVADEIILFMDSSESSINGVRLFRAIWNKMRKNLRLEDKARTAIITQHDRRDNMSKSFPEYIFTDPDVADINEITCRTVIPTNVKLKESTVLHKPINIYNKKTTGYEAYFKLINELKDKGVL